MKIGDTPPIGRPPSEGNVQQSPPSTEKKLSDTSSLSQGRLLKGTVLSVSAEGKTLLSIEGKTLSAKSLVPLKVGQELWFEVLREGGQPIVGTAGKKGAVIDLLRLLFSFNQAGTFPPDGNIANKVSIASQLGSPNLFSEIEHFLKLFSESGIGFESDPGKVLKNGLALGLFSKLQNASLEQGTLKAQMADFLASLPKQLAAGGFGNLEESKDLVRLLKLFESFGQLNSQAAVHEQQDFLLFPCFFSGATGWGEWLFSFNKDQEAGDDSCCRYGLSFFLELSNLGELHLQVLIRDNALQGIFSVPDEGVSRHVSENLAELSETLQNLGFQPVHLSCQLALVGNLQKLKEELAELAGKESFALIDVTI